jgi:FkbH-like protein
VVDLDDTLWGGVVGDVGWENLVLGGHHAAGESFRAFQRGLRTLSRRGIALGIVSKNTEAVALEAVDCHPEMVLRRDDFAAWRINWSDKADNVASLAAELRLGLHSVVFIDDNPAERERVRTALPEVLVPQWPADKLLYEQALWSLTCFDLPALTEEDRRRTRTYASRRDREPVPSSVETLGAYLRSLELKVTAEALGPANIVRAAQLLNKTNQMNLTTRRLTEDELVRWAAREGRLVYVFRVADRFEDYGLTGLASLAVDGDVASLTDFVVSCRVMGRGVEQAMLHALVSGARTLNASRVEGTYVATTRNAPCLAFFDGQSQFTRAAGAPRYSWDLLCPYPAPSHVAIEFHSGSGMREPCGPRS